MCECDKKFGWKSGKIFMRVESTYVLQNSIIFLLFYFSIDVHLKSQKMKIILHLKLHKFFDF